MTVSGYAVVDLETTGIAPEYGHRIIEVAVVHVSPTGAIEASYETVLNPQRDLGPSHIHGLFGRHVKDAPGFADVAGQLVDLLADRVLVAHNASFEARFLRAELERAGGYSPIENADALCTMRLAREFLPGAGRALADCCAAYDIALENAHEAMADAWATAELLAAYLGQDPRHPAWARHRALAESWAWPALERKRTPWVARDRGEARERSFLHDAMVLLPSDESSTTEEQTYLAQLDQALADGFISIAEADSLHELAAESGIGDSDRVRLHERYFDDLVVRVWADGVLTEDEAADVERVGELLDIPPTRRAEALLPRQVADAADSVSAPAPVAVLEPGAMVVLTGEMSRPRSHYEGLLRDRGFVPWAAVTKKIALVAAADPDSLSGKARKARDYGIPIVSEQELVELLADEKGEPSEATRSRSALNRGGH